MRIFRCFLILILLGVSSGLAMADTVAPGDPHMIPGKCTSGCGSISVTADNGFGSELNTGNGKFDLIFKNATAGIWKTFEVVIGADLSSDLNPNDYNDIALLSVHCSSLDVSCSRAFNTPTSVIVGNDGSTYLFYPMFTGDGVGGVAVGKDLILAGEFFDQIGQNIPLHLFANGTGPAAPVPEPGTLALLLAGIAGVVGRRKLRGNRADCS